MDIIVKGEVTEKTGELNLMGIALIVTIIVGVILFTKRIRKNENDNSPMPKWNSSKKNESVVEYSNDEEELQMWNDSD